jgi:hypothetical protein
MMTKNFQAVLDAYRDLSRRPLELKKYKSQGYQPLWVDGWPLKPKTIRPRKGGESMVHYEFLDMQEDGITVELHLESRPVDGLGNLIKNWVDNKKTGLQSKTIEWYTPWMTGEGRLVSHYPDATTPKFIAEEMVRLIDTTQADITTWVKKQNGLWGLQP